MLADVLKLSMSADEQASSSTALSAEPPPKPSSVSQVTHMNSYSADDKHLPGWSPSESLTESPCSLLHKLGEGELQHKSVEGFVRNPKLVKEDILAQKKQLELLRNGLDPAGLLTNAEELKAEANKHFGLQRWRTALVGYLGGLWFLRRGAPPCPQLVACGLAMGQSDSDEFKRAMATVADVVRSAEYVEVEEQVALRNSLHLNMAAAALKLEEWPLAKAACESVLAVDATHPKALFRLAKAHEGEGELGRAITVVNSLLKLNAQNSEARKLLDGLRKQQAERKGAFKGMFEEREEPGEASK